MKRWTIQWPWIFGLAAMCLVILLYESRTMAEPKTTKSQPVGTRSMPAAMVSRRASLSLGPPGLSNAQFYAPL